MQCQIKHARLHEHVAQPTEEREREREVEFMAHTPCCTRNDTWAATAAAAASSSCCCWVHLTLKCRVTLTCAWRHVWAYFSACAAVCVCESRLYILLCLCLLITANNWRKLLLLALVANQLRYTNTHTQAHTQANTLALICSTYVAPSAWLC